MALYRLVVTSASDLRVWEFEGFPSITLALNPYIKGIICPCLFAVVAILNQIQHTFYMAQEVVIFV